MVDRRLNDLWQQPRPRPAHRRQHLHRNPQHRRQLHSDDPNRCSSGLVSPAGRSAASLVIRYPNDRTASAAWKRGILDLPPPASEEQAPGLTQGYATGLGRNAWSYVRGTNGRPGYVAFWQNSNFDILVATGGLTSEQSRLGSVAVNGRVR